MELTFVDENLVFHLFHVSLTIILPKLHNVISRIFLSQETKPKNDERKGSERKTLGKVQI